MNPNPYGLQEFFWQWHEAASRYAPLPFISKARTMSINLIVGMKNGLKNTQIIFIEMDTKCWIPSLLWAEIDPEHI